MFQRATRTKNGVKRSKYESQNASKKMPLTIVPYLLKWWWFRAKKVVTGGAWLRSLFARNRGLWQGFEVMLEVA